MMGIPSAGRIVKVSATQDDICMGVWIQMTKDRGETLHENKRVGMGLLVGLNS